MEERGDFDVREAVDKPEASHTPPSASLAEPKETQELATYKPLSGQFHWQSHSGEHDDDNTIREQTGFYDSQ
jgi:hypothetical protein